MVGFEGAIRVTTDRAEFKQLNYIVLSPMTLNVSKGFHRALLAVYYLIPKDSNIAVCLALTYCYRLDECIFSNFKGAVNSVQVLCAAR